MATVVIRNNPGESVEGITFAVGAATTKLVEITVDNSATGIGGTRPISLSEVLQCLEREQDYIIKNCAALGIVP